jgi:hypothetical protein
VEFPRQRNTGTGRKITNDKTHPCFNRAALRSQHHHRQSHSNVSLKGGRGAKIPPEASLLCAQYGIIFGGEIRPKAGRYLHYKRKSSELWFVHVLELHAEVYLKKNWRFCLFHANIYFH